MFAVTCINLYCIETFASVRRLMPLCVLAGDDVMEDWRGVCSALTAGFYK